MKQEARGWPEWCQNENDKWSSSWWKDFAFDESFVLLYICKTLGDDLRVSDGYFSGLIDIRIKMKQEASGWPEWCQSENDKWRYIRDYHEKEGILLDYNNIKNNPGLRALAKLMLNSFWGKFGQRSNMPQIKYISEPAEYFDMLTSDQILVMGNNFVSDEIVEMRYQYKGLAIL
jgi:hypothetical protein